MKKKNLQKLIVTVLTVTFLTSTLSNVALGKTKDYSSELNYTDIVNGIKSNVNYSSNNMHNIINKDVNTTTNDKVSVIVEFISNPLALTNSDSSTYSKAETNVDRDHRIFKNYLSHLPSTHSSEDNDPIITHTYKTTFNGVALKIKGTEIKSLINSGVVKRIHNDSTVSITPPIYEENTSDLNKNEINPFMMDSIPKLGIDTLHKEGFTGEGIKVGVIDTGIDYNHPDLTNVYHGFRSDDGDSKAADINSTIGWDFVDNDADPMETTYNDWLESGQSEFDAAGSPFYTSHGTHVSGTIAGTGENDKSEIAVLGIAPDVELYSYRVLGPYGSGAISGIIAAIEKSIKDGMDVINLSLGSSGTNGPYDPLAEATNNAVLAGVVTVIANGNSGPNSYTVGTPGSAQLPIAVGASTVDVNVENYSILTDSLDIKGRLVGKSLVYSLDDLLDKETEIVYCNLGSEEDFKDKDLTGKIALVDRGVLTFMEKADNASKVGALAVIVANNVEDNDIPFLGEGTGSNIIAITLEDGNTLKDKLNSNNIIKLIHTGSTIVEGDEVTNFSSVGPVRQTYEIRPDIIAPGSNVYSTIPEFINDKDTEVINYSTAYQRMSGTSMASPHIAGIAALILQNNPDYSPVDVKKAIMNTSEHIHKKDGSSYSVHETGAGRVNAYEAVHEKVSFSSTYQVTAGDDYTEFENTTGMLSFGKFLADDKSGLSKTLPITIKNPTSEVKEYNIEVEYSDSERANNAIKNNISLSLPKSVKIASGTSETFDVILSGSNPLNYGTYEGFIHFTDIKNPENKYQMPFSITILKDGFANLTYPSLSNGFGKGITAFTSSDLFERHPMTHYGLGDISIMLQVNEEIKFVEAYVTDPDTKERLGYAGKQDVSWLPAGFDTTLEGFLANGKAKKLVNGKVSHEEFPVPEGIYLLEVVATQYDGNTFNDYLPMAIINDTYSDKITFNMDEGIHEVTDDMYSYNTWYDGKEHEGIWLSTNVFNEYVDILKNQYGMDYLEQSEVNTMFANGTSRNGHSFQIGNMPKEDGNILIAGVEREDLKDGFFRVDLSYANAGKVMNKPYSFSFVDKEKGYLSIKTNTETLSEETSLTSTISINNAKNITKGSFTIQNTNEVIFDKPLITPSKELEKLVGDNIKTDISYELNDDPWNPTYELKVSFEILSSDKSFKGINGDMELFNITTKVKNLNSFDEDLINDNNFVYTTIKGISGEFFDISGDTIDIMAETIYKTFDLEYTKRTLIYGTTSSPWSGMVDANVYAIDPNGNRYEPTYFLQDKFMGRSHLFSFNELPVIDGDYKVILEMPGCFNSIMNVPGSKVNEDGNIVGNTFGITSYSFLSPSMTSYAGDTNGDGAIDILDAIAIGNDYTPGQEHLMNYSKSDKNTLVTDLNQDGVVDYFDMYLLLSNYLMQDLTRSDSKTPEETFEGRDIYDILEQCGYFDEVPHMNVTLEIDKISSTVGDEVNLSVIPATDEAEFDYEFAVRELNDKNWTVIKERSNDPNCIWTSKSSGQYEFRARVFLDEIDYIWQDNKFHSVNWADLEGITISNENLVDGVINLNTGDTTKLKAEILPWNAMPQEFIWSSSDESIVKIENGKITALKSGTSEIEVRTIDNKFKAHCTVNVSDILLDSIELNQKSLTLNVGENSQLNVKFNPENATNKNVIWTSDDDSIASVKDGKVLGVSAGSTTIIVTSEDGKLSDSCIVEVKKDENSTQKPNAEKISLNKNKAKLNIGDKLHLEVSISPNDAKIPELIWTSSNEKIVSVKNGVVTAISEGDALIKVSSKDGTLSDTCHITVSKQKTDSSLPQTGSPIGNNLIGISGIITLITSSLIIAVKKKENS